MTKKKEITAIILAGGKSSRMLQDKGLVYLNDKMMIEYVIEKVKRVTSQIIIITQNPQYNKLGYCCFKDRFKDKGPLAGIYTGLIHSYTQKNLVLGCDTPFISENILQELINNSRKEDVLITEHEGKKEPLFAVYDKTCIPHFHARLKQGNLKITDALQGLKTAVINFDNKNWISDNEFANINTPEELKQFKITKK